MISAAIQAYVHKIPLDQRVYHTWEITMEIVYTNDYKDDLLTKALYH